MERYSYSLDLLEKAVDELIETNTTLKNVSEKYNIKPYILKKQVKIQWEKINRNFKFRSTFQSGFEEKDENILLYKSLPGFKEKATYAHYGRLSGYVQNLEDLKLDPGEINSRTSYRAKHLFTAEHLQYTTTVPTKFAEPDYEFVSEHSELEICRLCMNSLDNSKSLITEDIEILVETLTGQKLNPSSKYPRHICTICSNRLDDVENFKIEIKNSQDKIEQLLNGQDISLKVEPFLIESTNEVNLYDQIDTNTHQVIQPEEVYIKIEPEDSDQIVYNSFTDPNQSILDESEIKLEEIPEPDVLVDRPKKSKSKILSKVQEMEAEMMIIDDNLIKSSRIRSQQAKKREIIKLKFIDLQKQKIERIKLKKLKEMEILLQKAKKKELRNMRFREKRMQKYKFECDICGLKATEKERMRTHVQNVHNKYKYCEPCKRYFIGSSYTRHQETVHQVAELKCTKCDKTFPNAYKLRYHFKAYHTSKIICVHCGELIPHVFMVKHIAKNHSKSTCEICGTEFPGKLKLAIHMRSVHLERAVDCGLCGKTFQNDSKMKRHKTRFHGTKRWKCPVPGCTQLSALKQSLKIHLGVHKHLTEFEKIEILKNVKVIEL